MIELLIAVSLIVVIKHLFKSKPVNQSELIEAKLSNSEYRANKRAYR